MWIEERPSSQFAGDEEKLIVEPKKNNPGWIPQLFLSEEGEKASGSGVKIKKTTKGSKGNPLP